MERISKGIDIIYLKFCLGDKINWHLKKVSFTYEKLYTTENFCDRSSPNTAAPLPHAEGLEAGGEGDDRR